MVRKIVGGSNDDDVMQDFVIQLFAKLSQFRFESSLETWAHRMAVNQSLQYFGKTNREVQRTCKVALVSDMVVDPSGQNQRCNGKSCKIIAAAGQLAVCWKDDDCQLTLIGANDIAEVNQWVASKKL